MEYQYLENDPYRGYNNEPLGFAHIKEVMDLRYCLAKFNPQNIYLTGIRAGSKECRQTLAYLNGDADYLKYYYSYCQDEDTFTKEWRDRLIIRINPDDLSLWQEDGLKQVVYAPIEDTIYILRRKGNVFINEVINGNRHCHENNLKASARMSAEYFALSEEEEEEFRKSFATGLLYPQPLIMYLTQKGFNSKAFKVPDYETNVTLDNSDETIKYYEVVNGNATLKKAFNISELPKDAWRPVFNSKFYHAAYEPDALYATYRTYVDAYEPYLKQDGPSLKREI